MIKNIIFDVGKVLVEYDWESVMMRLGITGKDLEETADATVRSQLWNEYDRSRLSDEELLQGFLAQAPEQKENICLLWEHVADTITRFPYSESWVQSLRDKGYRCYILSNYARRTYERTREELSFEKKMDGALFSFQVQQIKPEPEIYRTLLERFGLEASECVFLDDNPDNVEAAERLGIHGILFTGKEAAEEKLRALGVE